MTGQRSAAVQMTHALLFCVCGGGEGRGGGWAWRKEGEGTEEKKNFEALLGWGNKGKYQCGH